MGILLGTAVVVVIAGVGITFMQKRKRNSAPAPEIREKESPVSEKDAIVETMDSLLSLNLMMRTDPDLDQDVLLAIERIIDDIRLILPAMLERYPSESLTYELEKIGKNHLKKIVKEYLDLSLPSREAQHAIFTGTIENLSQVTKRSRQIIENNETAEFKTMAHFLAGKFSS